MTINKRYTWVNPSLIEERLDVDYYEPDVTTLLNKICSYTHGFVRLAEVVIKKQSEPQTVSSMFKEQKDERYRYPVLKMKSLRDFYIDYSELVYINDEDFDKLREFELKPGMVIYGLTGSLGQASVVPNNIPKAITNRRIAQIVINEKRANPYYIATFLNLKYGTVVEQFSLQ